VKRPALVRFVLATLLGPSPLAWAEDRAADDAAVRAHFTAFAEAFASGDARGVASGYAEDADIVRPNQPPVAGRAAIEAFYSQMFDGPLKGVAKAGAVDRVRFVTPTVAVVDSSYTLDRDEPPLHAPGRVADRPREARGTLAGGAVAELPAAGGNRFRSEALSATLFLECPLASATPGGSRASPRTATRRRVAARYRYSGTA
jgi:uncharacterized protein (TIGR02246 family)